MANEQERRARNRLIDETRAAVEKLIREYRKAAKVAARTAEEHEREWNLAKLAQGVERERDLALREAEKFKNYSRQADQEIAQLRAELARLTTPLASAELAQIEREHATVAASFDRDGVSPKDSAEAHRNRGVLLAEIRRLTTETENRKRRAQGWESEATIATERFNQLAAAQPGEPLDMDCGDSSCAFAKTRGGMRTNGGCRCLENLGFCRGQTDSLRRMAAEIVSLRKRLSDLTTPRPIAEAPRDGTNILGVWLTSSAPEVMHWDGSYWTDEGEELVYKPTHYLPLPEVKP